MPATQTLEWPVIEAVLGGARLTLLYGPPGTGKTTAAVNAAKARKVSVYNVTLTDETPAAELRGHWIPGEGAWHWHDGPAVRAFREGATLILNEIDKASADALDFCHALLDDPGISALTLPTGETVFPNEGFRCVATCNGAPEDLPEALADRFAVSVYVGTPHPDAVASLPADLRSAGAALDTADERPATLRRLKAFAALRDTIGADDAAAAVFAHRATEVLSALKLAGVR